MVVYNFKQIRAVPTAEDFVNIVLSKTQRKTPTVVHQGYAIGRIRSFYMRKVKYTQENFVDKLTWVLDDFPRLDDIHPFYADLCNVLYDRDHYKLALGQLNVAKNLITNISKDYVRMLKYGESLYRCKQLKRAALGRMCTVMKKQKASLAYLEEVRKHLSRLPSIDPNTRTLLVTGYPNVGKSSFMNKVTRADVEVQPYAFTTKSLFVGHMDYKYLRWQVLDTPGILDKPLEDRNTIEMQAITALAHLQCSVLYFMDLSEQCGWTIEQQAALFDNIRPLFANKPLIIVANKTDLVSWEDLEDSKRVVIENLAKEADAKLMKMSSVAEVGVSEVKQLACDLLLERRVEMKMKSRKLTGVLNRLSVTVPKPRDSKVREATIPESVVQAKLEKKSEEELDDDENMMVDDEQERPAKKTKRLEKDIMWEQGGPGVYSADLTKHWRLANPEHTSDAIPEIMNGKNIADFYDPEIEKKLDELEREEDEMLKRLGLEEEDNESVMDEEEQDILRKIKKKKGTMIAVHRAEKHKNRSTVPRPKLIRSGDEFKSGMESHGYDTTKVEPQVARGRKRTRSNVNDVEMDVEGTPTRSKSRAREMSKARSKSRDPSRARSVSVKPGDGYKDLKAKIVATKLMKQSQKRLNTFGRAGEADRHIGDKMPKFLFSGKRGNGKTNRR